jgi:hypothetical protein
VQEDLSNLLRRAVKKHKTPKRKRTQRRPRSSANHAQAARARKKRHIRKRRIAPPAPFVFCGAGNLARCRTALEASLRDALHVSRTTLYHDPGGRCTDGDQMCFDSIRFRPLGGVTQPLIPWVNRPTYQQANEIQGHS